MIQPLLNWALLMEAAREPADCVYFIHNLETHIPFLSGNPTVPLIALEPEFFKKFRCPGEVPTETLEQVKKLRKDALEYVDRQLEFCLSLLPLDKDDVIITADHGQNGSFLRATGIPYTQEQMKVPFIIHSKSVKPGVYEKIYSAIEMPKLLRQLIGGAKELKIDSLEYAQAEMEPAYGRALEFNVGNILSGCIALFTESERYMFFLNGMEWNGMEWNGMEQFSLLSDPGTELINDERYKERIDYFRSQIDIDTREVWRFMFEKYPHLRAFHKDNAEAFLNENKNPNAVKGRISDCG